MPIVNSIFHVYRVHGVLVPEKRFTIEAATAEKQNFVMDWQRNSRLIIMHSRSMEPEHKRACTSLVASLIWNGINNTSYQHINYIKGGLHDKKLIHHYLFIR
jgi:hypothetical protein